MKENIRIAAGQINTTVGDLQGNCAKVLKYVKEAASKQVDIISFPELTITGYPPEDLLLKPKFIQDNLDALSSLQKKIKNIIVIIGFVDRKKNSLYNAAAVLHNGKKVGVYYKMLLPNYGVFNEKRYFSAGTEVPTFRFSGISFGINISEDIWHTNGPVERQAKDGAKIIFNINGSPYHLGKREKREMIVREQSIKNSITVCYTNLVGGQDEIVFDGNSFIVDNKGNITYTEKPFKEGLLIWDISLDTDSKEGKDAVSIPHTIVKNKQYISVNKYEKISEEEEVYLALMTGLKDYTTKNSFRKVVLGLSGGIDSSLVAVIAADALGAENVTGVFMPSRYSSWESAKDAEELAKNTGINFMKIPIDEIFSFILETLSPAFAGKKQDVTEENLQARIRGTILMALSNKFNSLVLTTGNKSEMSVGYATLYGDMAGGFAVIKDVYKTLVYKLARWRNSKGYTIPERVFTKAPTAELRPGQKDQDTLPPYEILDGILKEYIEKDSSYSQIVKAGFAPDTVKKVMAMVDRSEYKRKQAPPGIKITPRAFGRDRRMPLTNHYKI